LETLTENRNSLGTLTEQLLDRETLTKEEVDKILEETSDD
jgi:ATP-dependent Zn protease